MALYWQSGSDSYRPRRYFQTRLKWKAKTMRGRINKRMITLAQSPKIRGHRSKRLRALSLSRAANHRIVDQGAKIVARMKIVMTAARITALVMTMRMIGVMRTGARIIAMRMTTRAAATVVVMNRRWETTAALEEAMIVEAGEEIKIRKRAETQKRSARFFCSL
jgi:hypothetical protein